LARHGG